MDDHGSLARLMWARLEPVHAVTCSAPEPREVCQGDAPRQARDAVEGVTDWAVAWTGQALVSGGLAGLVRQRSSLAARVGIPHPDPIGVPRPGAGGPEWLEGVA